MYGGVPEAGDTQGNNRDSQWTIAIEASDVCRWNTCLAKYITVITA